MVDFRCDLVGIWGSASKGQGWVVSFEIFSFRFTDSDFKIHQRTQRLVALKTFMSHLNAAGLSAFVTQLLLQKLQVSLSNAIAFLRDSAAVNGAAVHTLSTTFNGARPERAV